jgi:Protein ChrB, N-terminal
VQSTEWELFLYRLPSEPSRTRVAVWRELRRLGALPLGQAVVAVPCVEHFTVGIDAIEERVTSGLGTSYRFKLPDLGDAQRGRLQADWNALREHEYAEIVEECETKFLKEIEFEIFRGNLTASEAEEIEADLEKIKSWYGRICGRDVFDAPRRSDAEQAIRTCEQALDDFVERVYETEARTGPGLDAPADLSWADMPDTDTADVADLRPDASRRPRSKKPGTKKGRRSA